MIIFLCPAALDAVLFLVLFAVSYGAGERGMTLSQCGWLGGVFQLVYMLSSPVSGLLLTRRNAKGILIVSTVSSIGLGIAGVVLTGFAPLMVTLSALGAATAFFFNSFQTFMRGESPPGGLARTTAIYTLAWSFGASTGFLISGTVYSLGVWALTALTAAIGAAVLAILSLHRARSHDKLSADEHVEPAHGGVQVEHSAYVWVAWIMIFTAMFVQRPIMTYYPAQSALHGVTAALAGIPLFLHMLAQGAAGGAMLRARRLLYRRFVLAAVQWSAALVLLLLWQFPSYGLSLACISLLGIWTGFAYFCCVYYASNSGNRSLNIGMNECLVGLGSFAGLFVSEWAMRRTGAERAMYAVCAAALLLSGGLQWLVAGRPAR